MLRAAFTLILGLASQVDGLMPGSCRILNGLTVGLGCKCVFGDRGLRVFALSIDLISPRRMLCGDILAFQHD